jgi:hypothetical protein
MREKKPDALDRRVKTKISKTFPRRYPAGFLLPNSSSFPKETPCRMPKMGRIFQKN